MPIAIGATGPKMTELGGEIADIVLLPTFTTAAFVKIARQRMATGAAKSGRAVDAIRIGATLPFSVADDEAEARDAIRVTTAVYIANKLQNIRDDTLMNAAGLTEGEARPIADKLQSEGAPAAARMVTNKIMDKVRDCRHSDAGHGSASGVECTSDCAGRCSIRCSVRTARPQSA